MLSAIRIPSLDSSTEKATLLRILIAPGQAVSKGAVIAEIETEKTTFPVESALNGKVSEHLASVGAELAVGAAIVSIETDDAGAEPFDKSAAVVNAPVAKSAGGAHLYGITQPRNVLFNSASGAAVQTLPPAMRYGGGPVEETAEKFAAKDVPLAETRKLAGSALRTQQRMLYSAHQIPTSSVSVPVAIAALREKIEVHRAAAKQRLNPTDVIIWAAAQALKDFPELNAYRHGDEVRVYGEINVGIVYDIKGELSLPAVRKADTLPLPEFTTELRTIYKEITARSLPVSKLGIATFVVSNLFGAGAVNAHPLVNAGNSAVLLIGAPFQQALSDETGMRFVEHAQLVLGFDHSIVNGVRASAFLRAVRSVIEKLEL